MLRFLCFCPPNSEEVTCYIFLTNNGIWHFRIWCGYFLFCKVLIQICSLFSVLDYVYFSCFSFLNRSLFTLWILVLELLYGWKKYFPALRSDFFALSLLFSTVLYLNLLVILDLVSVLGVFWEILLLSKVKKPSGIYFILKSFRFYFCVCWERGVRFNISLIIQVLFIVKSVPSLLLQCLLCHKLTVLNIMTLYTAFLDFECISALFSFIASAVVMMFYTFFSVSLNSLENKMLKTQ